MFGQWAAAICTALPNANAGQYATSTCKPLLSVTGFSASRYINIWIFNLLGDFEIMIIAVGRVVSEVTLTNSIRYANGDAVEQWLYDLLCLDVTDLPPLTGGTPDPASCDLYYINRDTLFSYDRAAETFLKHLVNLYVSSHYKVPHFLHFHISSCYTVKKESKK